MSKPPPKPQEPASRSQRLAEALRANLKRRKAQARSRAAVRNPPGEAKSRD
jgi:hypothetical protein